MNPEQNPIFRKSALERLSSPEQLDARLTLVAYRALLLVALPAVFGAAIYFGVLLLARVPEAQQLLPRPAAR